MKSAKYNQNILIPDGYEEILGRNLIEKGDKYYEFTCIGFRDVTKVMIGEFRDNWGTARPFIRPISIESTPEQKIENLKKKSKEFVDENIQNPTVEIYQKFELAFLKDDDAGL